MIAEIVSNGMLSLPSSLAVVGVVPGAVIIVFLGVFATYTSYILIQFKLRHPEGGKGFPYSTFVCRVALRFTYASKG
jgi:amino acid permease